MANLESALAGSGAFPFLGPMQRLAAFIVFSFTLLRLQAVSPLLTLKNELVPSPAPVGASAPEFLRSDNQIALRWKAAVSEAPSGNGALYASRTRKWSNTPVPAGFQPNHRLGPASEITVTHAGRVAKAWFVPDEKDPRVLLSTSTNGGVQFLMPQRIEDSRPSGPPDLVLLADGTVFVCWPEDYGHDETAIWLRRISPGGTLSVPVLLATLPICQPNQRLTIVKDFDDKPAELLLAFQVGQGETAQITTRLLTIDPPTDADRRNPCQSCPDPDEASRGYALRGTVVSVSANNATLVVQHGDSGVLPAGTTAFKVDDAVLQSAVANQELFARIEKRGETWWLFAPRWVVRAP